MKKPHRYILYFLIGFVIYFIIGADDNPALMDEIHRIAPALIIGIVVLLFVVRYIINKQKGNDDGDSEES